MQTTQPDFKKLLYPGNTDAGRLFVTATYAGGELSIRGVEGPLSNGDSRGSCGQCIEALDRIEQYRAGWTEEKAQRLKSLWERWHLNHMRAGCTHQREAWNHSEQIELVAYGLTSEASRRRAKAIERAGIAAAKNEPAALTKEERALILMEDWFRHRFAPPDADDPLSGCFEVKKRETKTAGWVKPEEHPRGLLCKPCEVCGYRYGSAWLKEAVPAEVLAEIEAMPAADVALPGAWSR